MLCYATTNKNIDAESKDAILNMWLSLDSKYHDFLSSEDIVVTEKDNPTQNQENSSLKELELSNKEENDETVQIKPLSEEEIDKKYNEINRLIEGYVEILPLKKALRYYSNEEYSQFLYNIEKINNLFWKLIYSSIYIYDGEELKHEQIFNERHGGSKDIIKSFLYTTTGNDNIYTLQLLDKENGNSVVNPDKVKQFFKVHFKRGDVYDGDYHISSVFCLEDQYYPFEEINGKDRLIINIKNIPFEIAQFYTFNKKSGEIILDLTDIYKAKELLQLLNERLTFKPLTKAESGADLFLLAKCRKNVDDYIKATINYPITIDYKPYKDEKPFEVFQRIIKEIVLRASNAVEIIEMQKSFFGRRKWKNGNYHEESEITNNSLKNLPIFIDVINNNKED